MNSDEIPQPDATTILDAFRGSPYVSWFTIGLCLCIVLFLVIDRLRAWRAHQRKLTGQMEPVGKNRKPSLLRKMTRRFFFPRY